MNKQIYYFTTTKDDTAYQIITSVPQIYIRSILMELAGEPSSFSEFVAKRSKNVPIESPIAELLRALKENIYEVFFPTGHVWNKNNKNIHVENMTRYRYYVRKYQQQESRIANQQKG